MTAVESEMLRSLIRVVSVVGLCLSLPSILAAQVPETQSRILFDQGHGQRSPGGLRGIATRLGLSIETTSDPITSESLNNSQVFFSRSATEGYTEDEKAAIVDFVRNGGSLLLVTDEERRTPLAETGVNDLIAPFGLSFTDDTEYLHNCGGTAKAGAICQADREVPFSGGRAVEGGTPFAFQLDEDSNEAQPFATFKEIDGGGRIVVMGDAMAALLMGTAEGERLSGVPRDPTRTTYWGKDSRTFMGEVFAWLAGVESDESETATPITRQRDLIANVDLSESIVAGTWEKTDGELRVTASPHSRVILPAQTSGSYSLTVEFTRTDGDNSVGVILPVGSSQCVYKLSVFDGEAHGIGVVDGGLARDNSTTIMPGTLENGNAYRLLIEVEVNGEKASISSQLDGRSLLQWSGNPSSLTMLDIWKLPDGDSLGLIADSDVTFHSVVIRPLDPTMRMTPQPSGQ